MSLWAIAIEGYHEGPYRVIPFEGTLKEAHERAERLRFEFGRLDDVDITAELYNDRGDHVGTFTRYPRGQPWRWMGT